MLDTVCKHTGCGVIMATAQNPQRPLRFHNICPVRCRSVPR